MVIVSHLHSQWKLYCGQRHGVLSEYHPEACTLILGYGRFLVHQRECSFVVMKVKEGHWRLMEWEKGVFEEVMHKKHYVAGG